MAFRYLRKSLWRLSKCLYNLMYIARETYVLSILQPNQFHWLPPQQFYQIIQMWVGSVAKLVLFASTVKRVKIVWGHLFLYLYFHDRYGLESTVKKNINKITKTSFQSEETTRASNFFYSNGKCYTIKSPFQVLQIL